MYLIGQKIPASSGVGKGSLTAVVPGIFLPQQYLGDILTAVVLRDSYCGL